MIEGKYGRVIFTSSTAGLVAEYAGSAYGSSKHALLGLMRSVAQDAGSYGITSNAVLPGWVPNGDGRAIGRHEAKDRGITTDQVWEERAALYLSGRAATPREVAPAEFPISPFLTAPESQSRTWLWRARFSKPLNR